MESTVELLELINKFSMVIGKKINIKINYVYIEQYQKFKKMKS